MGALYGIIGSKLGHSFSGRFFGAKFAAEGIDAEYRNFELASIDELPSMLAANPGLCGFNVTMPYKQDIFRYLDAVDPEAEAVGAVNCVKIENGKLTGYNTDVYGFRLSLLGLIGNERPQALVLGTGGAAKAVWHVLEGLGIDHLTVSRTERPGMITYDTLKSDPSIISERRLVVNTTPLGMFPDTQSAPDIPYPLLTPQHYLFDLVYNPPATRFLIMGDARGAKVTNGQRMLELQAERSWEIWVGNN